MKERSAMLYALHWALTNIVSLLPLDNRCSLHVDDYSLFDQKSLSRGQGPLKARLEEELEGKVEHRVMR